LRLDSKLGEQKIHAPDVWDAYTVDELQLDELTRPTLVIGGL